MHKVYCNNYIYIYLKFHTWYYILKWFWGLNETQSNISIVNHTLHVTWVRACLSDTRSSRTIRINPLLLVGWCADLTHRDSSTITTSRTKIHEHDVVIKWKHFPRHWPFVRGIHRPPVNSPQKGQWRGALMCLWSSPEQTAEQTIETRVIWDAIALIMTSL